MAWTHYQIVLAVVMVATGSINTLTTAWADRMSAAGSDGVIRKFSHPFVQGCSMFLGELACLVVFKIFYVYYRSRNDGSEIESDIVRGNTHFNPLLFVPPAVCDMLGTSLMYVGLNLTYPSSFQMLRGAIIIFTALLSVAFLEKKIKTHEWVGIFGVIIGLVTVGYSDYILIKEKSPADQISDLNGIITGDMLILMATIIQAVQMVYEEKFVVSKDIPPLQAVGWEGVFGFVILGSLLYPFYYIPVNPPFSNNAHHVIEDLPDALAQMRNNPLIIYSILGTIVSIAFFNYAGISVTKEMSATTRMILDSVRTLFVWIVSLQLNWQKYHPLQLLGFALLIFGTAAYNNIRPASLYSSLRSSRSEEENDETPIIVTPPDQPTP
ncbi:unnamed protein product [Bemisia tabaci]|uniref:Solute carrier family 35 member F6 n=1 Tax=Bemisia tabaci TaxID=7038 RepID=A0A9P0EW15_BEMTA|nr:PREDICTED: solute carrier family 35 member F6-like [Bemisia tabaci]CAH0381491.1 unnamed protein product [Bemisia tabaci]